MAFRRRYVRLMIWARAPMFREYERFQLAQPLPSETIPVGTVGVVLIVYEGVPCAYEVEFVDHTTGGNLGSRSTFTITDEFMSLMSST